MLDKTIRDMEERQKTMNFPDPYAAEDGEESRRLANALRAEFYPKPVIPVGSVETVWLPGPAGQIEARIVRPVHGRGTGSVVYFHGGGWIVGDLDSHEAHVARIANRCDATVINIHYRRAPENTFPAATDDAFAALEWAAANIGRLGGDAAKLAVAGDSAGGNLAAAAAIHARDKGIPLSAQLLLYAATDLRPKRGAAEEAGSVVGRYLGPDRARNALDWRASPVLGNLKGVAPAIIGVGIYDFLYKENLAFAEATRAAGVPTILHEFPTLNHSYFSYAGVVTACAEASDLMCDELKVALHGA